MHAVVANKSKIVLTFEMLLYRFFPNETFISNIFSQQGLPKTAFSNALCVRQKSYDHMYISVLIVSSCQLFLAANYAALFGKTVREKVLGNGGESLGS